MTVLSDLVFVQPAINANTVSPMPPQIQHVNKHAAEKYTDKV